jgi:galactokinase
MTMSSAQDLFQDHFKESPQVVAEAPGRLELLGNHTDYNQGLVLSMSLDRHLNMAASPRSDEWVEVVSSAFPELERFSIHDLKKSPVNSWTDYVKGPLAELRKLGIPFRGFNAAIHGTLPVGAGMSSSAALEIVTVLAVRLLYPFALGASGWRAHHPDNPPDATSEISAREKLALARACQAAENHFVGVNCGILDQISSLFGRPSHAILTDCQTLEVELIPLVGEVSIVICHSGVKHALVEGEYNELRRHCEAAALALGVASLRSVSTEVLESWRGRLPARDFACARHIVDEIHRVRLGEKALRAGDFAKFGRYMFESHASSRDFFKNSAPELDLLVEIAREHRACLGARLTGGGFGGSTISLVENPAVQDFIDFIAKAYEKRSGRPTEPLLCHFATSPAPAA